ncbi:MAG: EamA family transporter RarD [Campylobacterales bacterium]|nr:EamA family transporter RarD [Campylobacterales bacterium]
MKEEKLGYIFAIIAFLLWGGVAPIYFKEVAAVTPLEVISHRVLWSILILLPLLFITKQTRVFISVIIDSSKLKYLFFSTILISINWLVFIWAIGNNKILEASLGYYINPLINVFLGFIFFSERMSRNQYIAIFIAFLAVLYQFLALGSIPIVSLILATSFGIYGMIRKKVNIGSIAGLLVETLILLPFAFSYLYYLYVNGNLEFINADSYISIMLSLGGLMTVVPLLLFNGAATRMKLSTLGFFQYIGPSFALMVAVFIYGEELNSDKMITFILIWIALLIFSIDAIRNKLKKDKNEN